MSHIDKQCQEFQKTIDKTREAQGALETLRELVEAFERAYPKGTHFTYWFNRTFGLNIGLTVKNLSAEMAEHLSIAENLGIPLEAWTTSDDPENRKRYYTASHTNDDGVELEVVFIAYLADDATCRIEILGYEEKEERQYVSVKKTVPITQLVCA